jgi:hypothetical protein
MKRRTFRQLREGKSASPGEASRNGHHSVYVVLLDEAVLKYKSVQRLNPHMDASKPCVYVGMSGLAPEERFQNHKAGNKAAGWVQRFGIRLLPDLYQWLNPMPYEAAVAMERELAEDLRQQGYTVLGGH